MVSTAVAGDEHSAVDAVTFDAPSTALKSGAGLFGANPYASVFIGGNFGGEFDGNINTNGVPLDIELEDGISYGLAFGVDTNLLGGTRLEIEGFYSDTDVDFVALNGTPLPSNGNIDTLGFSVNLIKDFHLGAFTPYVGAGIGYTQVRSNFNYQGGVLIQVDENDEAFTYKFIGGLGYDITENLTFFTEYNYNVIGDVDFARNPTPTRGEFEDEGSHIVRAGFRFTF